ncbi:hypothetical protein A2996_01380 [Candidatus Campbellbacteria bacterium RIFCSPLOWO2_01_FULL_34_15]|uniref:Uncharacterized protein n=2 Tax=Candidatus Campbelliibacteriota TaxID=1752727 RepID=A0A1F5EPK0_9BACT|nr:MAG: hypothetical protein A2811_00560 [Candidatus Campbellbacteria bacterium RIFCSPHIGHO2_01_FULL_34_10]OGD69250.1 MAG: hypothetical protein A2996_01380 [Candidatus Campbellbacteria bacterium RIFCSPLOWO2_01_FULL_34_15]
MINSADPNWASAFAAMGIVSIMLIAIFLLFKIIVSTSKKELAERVKKVGKSVVTEKIYIDETVWTPKTKEAGSFGRILGDGSEYYDEMATLPPGEKPNIEVKYFISSSYSPKELYRVKRTAKVNLAIFNKQMLD